MTRTEENPFCAGGVNRTTSQQVFTNNLILREIVKTCSVDDLKCFRLLNTACYNACQPFWTKKAAVCIGHFHGWGRISVQELMGRIENQYSDACIVTSFQNFQLEFCTLPPTDLKEEDIQTSAEYRFWKVCGPEMKHLHLKHCTFDQKKLINVIFNLAPNLETLIIQGIQKTCGASILETEQLTVQRNLKVLHVSGKLPFPNWRFLKYFPNLQEINLSNYTNPNLIPDLSDLRRKEQGNILSLKRLDVIHTEQSLHGLAEARFPLVHLSLRLERDVQEDALRDILNCQFSTLQSLQLFRFPLPHWSPLSSSPLQVNFTSLKELHLWGKVVSSFNFLKWMPSLKKLVVDLLCHSNSFDIYESSSLRDKQPIDPYFGDMVQASSVLLMNKEDFEHPNLEYFQMDFAFREESLKMLGRWMPHLKVFKGILNDDTLRLGCRQWTKLEHLKLLFGSDVTDEGITGITLASSVGKEDRLQNLTDLNELRSFELECYCDMSPLTDACVHFAFLRMPHLESLRVCVSPQMTLETEALLKQSIPQVQIHRNYGESHFNKSINCCQRVAFYFNNESLLNRR